MGSIGFFWQNVLANSLEDWEIIIRDLSLGFLISGILIFLLTVFLQGLHLFDHDTDLGTDHDLSVDHDIGIDHDLSVDHDIGIDHDLSVDHDIGVDHDLSADHDVGVDHDLSIDQDLGGEYGTPAPLFLLAATFLLVFGALGTSFYSLGDKINPFVRLAVVVSVPIISTLIVSWSWKKLAKSSLIELEVKGVRANDDVIALTNIDEDGGLVRAEYTKEDGVLVQIKLPAKTLPGVTILKGATAYIIDKQGSTLLVDEWPNQPNKK